MNLLIAVAVLLGGWWLIRSFAKSSPQQARALSGKIGGYVLLAFAGLMALRGQFEFALPVGAVALGMLGYQQMLGKFKGQGGQGAKDAGAQQQHQREPTRSRVKMSRDEALRVLGLGAGATTEDVKAAHRRLLKDYHPDKGGSDYLASKINEAKDVLMKS
jgi:DnaJ domain